MGDDLEVTQVVPASGLGNDRSFRGERSIELALLTPLGGTIFLAGVRHGTVRRAFCQKGEADEGF